MRNTSYIVLGIKWLLSFAVFALAVWTIQVAPDWSPFAGSRTALQLMCIAALAVGLLEYETWQRLARLVRLPAMLLHFLTHMLLVIITALITPATLSGYTLVVITYALLNLALLFISVTLRERNRAGLVNLAVSLFSLLFTLILIELLSPALTNAIASAQRQASIEAAAAAATRPLDADEITTGQASTPPPVSASPQTEIIQPGGGPAWGMQTGWGTNTDTVLRYWMEGVYDNEIAYNSLGFRGPEISYEKPDDVYRVMLVGDSFIEAREVRYEDTVYAQLADVLAESRTPDGKRPEVFGIGATGWGTLQAYLYYHHEGHRFNPDLIIHVFIINDVADNHPQHFYRDRNIDFVIHEDSVHLLTDGSAPEERALSPGERWLDALSPALAQTNTAALLRRVIAPPRESVTLAGNLGKAHPQNYIFVREPEIEGYPEAWRRTQHAYEIWAREAQSNGTQLMVLAVDISIERITEISTYYPDEQDNWVWDVDLPYTRLEDILTPLNVNLILTRDYYADYAASINQRPFDAFFYPQDGHWNPTGHQVTAALLAENLRDRGIIAE